VRRSATSRIRMKWKTAACISAAFLMAMPQLVSGLAVDGTVLNNLVSATYHGVSGVAAQYEVSYQASAEVIISCPVLSLQKRSNITLQNVGGEVTFILCAINDSFLASAFNVTIRDRMPDNVAWSGSYGTWGTAFDNELYSTDDITYSGDLTGVQPGVGDAPLWFLWTATIGPMCSACVQYAVTVQ
jgi:hypothetical protein